ncbi:MAG: extracellular solute-binding protein [Victivallales bacterium]|nr:extracellular solute-binding protein [Victivallales bacterium]
MMASTKCTDPKNWPNFVGLLILLICYVGAIYNVFQVKKDEMILGKTVIRIAHWQIEAGITDALDRMIELYEAKHPNVKVIQLPVPERAYGQWAVTQLIGRTAPELIELGMFDVKAYLGRFFVPITAEVSAPNPYNAENPELKDVPWKDTFTDGLQNCYIPELLDYYAVGFSQFTVRLYYNKTLFKRILGTDEPPENLAQFFSYCDRIQEYVKQRNEEIENYNQRNTPKKTPLVIYPISSSKYQVSVFRSRYSSSLTADRCLELDTNYDGNVSEIERLAAIMTGDLTFDDRKLRAGNEVVKDLTKYFNPGFMSAGREDAGFAFVQGRAAIITSGSWDAGSYIKQVKDQPFGDIIIEVAGEKVANAHEAEARLKGLSGKDSARVELLIDREGAKKTLRISPIKGNDVWSAYGFRLEDHEKNGAIVAVVTEVDSASPASVAGVRERKTFEIGFSDFPLPTKDDPRYGKYIVGRVAESADTGFKFGVVKFSKNRDTAIDFLQFCTTPENNEELNRIANWIPAVRGAKPVDFLKEFEPNFQGYWNWLHVHTGNRVKMLESQLYWPYISGGTTFDEYVSELRSRMPQEAAIDYANHVRTVNEQVPDKHVRRSVFLAKSMFATDKQSRLDAERKLAASWDTVVSFEKEEPMTKAIMREALNEKRNATDFSRDFFKHYTPPRQ